MKATTKQTERIIVLTDNRDFDNHGRQINLNSIAKEKEDAGDVLEPFDPAYLTEEEDKNPCRLERGEVTVCRMTGILQKKLIKAGLRPVWNGASFELTRVYRGVEMERYCWIDEEDNTYCYGTSEDCLVYGKSVQEIIDKAVNFMTR